LDSSQPGDRHAATSEDTELFRFGDRSTRATCTKEQAKQLHLARRDDQSTLSTLLILGRKDEVLSFKDCTEDLIPKPLGFSMPLYPVPSCGRTSCGEEAETFGCLEKDGGYSVQLRGDYQVLGGLLR
jgi:hypothetical protein